MRRQAGLDRPPLGATMTRRGDVPWDVPVFGSDATVVVYSGVDLTVPASVRADVHVVVLDPLDPAAVVADLRARGARSILCEGGATLNAALLRAGQVDELELVVAPQVVGGTSALTAVHGPLGVDGRGADADRRARVPRRAADPLPGGARRVIETGEVAQRLIGVDVGGTKVSIATLSGATLSEPRLQPTDSGVGRRADRPAGRRHPGRRRRRRYRRGRRRRPLGDRLGDRHRPLLGEHPAAGRAAAPAAARAPRRPRVRRQRRVGGRAGRGPRARRQRHPEPRDVHDRDRRGRRHRHRRPRLPRRHRRGARAGAHDHRRRRVGRGRRALRPRRALPAAGLAGVAGLRARAGPPGPRPRLRERRRRRRAGQATATSARSRSSPSSAIDSAWASPTRSTCSTPR